MLAVLHVRRTFATSDAAAIAAIAWLGYENSCFEELFETNSASIYSTALDAFERLLSIASTEPLVLFVADSALRRELFNASPSFPGLTVVDAPRGRLSELARHASAALDRRSRAESAIPAPPCVPGLKVLPELQVATDASKAAHRRGVGLGCVSADGRSASKFCPRVSSILTGELLAIELAIKAFPRHPLHILTDSKGALACLTMSRSKLLDRYPGELLSVVGSITRLTERRDVRFSWVRGHSGNELNELADRLAVAARRHVDAGVDVHVREQITRNILGQLHAARAAA